MRAEAANTDMMLAVNLGLSLLVMYVAMFAMIWTWGEFIQNVNFFYMALVMCPRICRPPGTPRGGLLTY